MLDYHYQKETETDLLEYEKSKTYDDVEKLEIPAILPFDYLGYVYRVGRYNRFVESVYLLHLYVQNKTSNEYYLPYRIVDPNNFDQNEHTYYAIPKDKMKEVRSFFLI